MEVYELKCPNCGCRFSVGEKAVGKPPFDVECPECGEEVGSQFIVGCWTWNDNETENYI